MTGKCEIMWSFSRTGHNKGPHDKVQVVIKMEVFFIHLEKMANFITKATIVGMSITSEVDSQIRCWDHYQTSRIKVNLIISSSHYSVRKHL
jgi:hypothetical protein